MVHTDVRGGIRMVHTDISDGIKNDALHTDVCQRNKEPVSYTHLTLPTKVNV